MTEQLRAAHSRADVSTALAHLTRFPLLTVSSADLLVSGLLESLERLHVGVVVAGDAKHSVITALRRRHPSMTIATETVSAAKLVASESAPFLLPDEDLFGQRTLSDVLDEQLEAGASFAITPTGHVPLGESAALKAIVRTVSELDRDDFAVHLPVAAEWLRPDPQRQLAAIVARVRQPVLLSLAHATDPCTVAGVSQGLATFANQPHVVLHRTDLAGAEFLARGGAAATFGHRASLRHGTSKGFSPTPGDKSPRVLLPGRLQFMKSSEIGRTWANAQPPRCACPEDTGQPLDRYSGSSEDVHQAHRHNLQILHGIVTRVLQDELGREAAWAAMLGEAKFLHEQTCEELQTDLRLPQPLHDWMKTRGID